MPIKQWDKAWGKRKKNSKAPHKLKKNFANPGDKFGLLTLVRRIRADVPDPTWIAQCECGSPPIHVVEHYLFRKPNPKRHCGCEAKGLPTLHPREYSSWVMMHRRCYHDDHVSYKDYGGRGIKVYSGWHRHHPEGKGFENFVRDMGPRPHDTTLDRRDANGHYLPSNCRWATREVQANNKRMHIGQPKPTDTPPPLPREYAGNEDEGEDEGQDINADSKD